MGKKHYERVILPLLLLLKGLPISSGSRKANLSREMYMYMCKHVETSAMKRLTHELSNSQMSTCG